MTAERTDGNGTTLQGHPAGVGGTVQALAGRQGCPGQELLTKSIAQEAEQYADHVRKHGVLQFLNIWRKVKDLNNDELLWYSGARPFCGLF